jgi:signal transduction histidine kinase
MTPELAANDVDSKAERARSATTANVLLVDDNPANLLALEAVLEPLHCNLVRATSGEDALKQLLDHEFALLLVDVMMPGLNGFQTTDLIRSRQATRDVPIIFLTGMGFDPNAVSQAYARKAVDYLVKPFDPDALRSKVAVFIDLYVKNQELRAQTELARQREREAQARENAMAVVSHDLCNPIASINANATILRRKLESQRDVALLARVDAIQRAVERMHSLVGDLLDTARIQSGSLSVELRREDIVTLVRQCADILGAAFAERQQRIELNLPSGSVPVMCDRNRILQVLSNLLGNAGKFSPAQSVISTELSLRPGEVTIAIRDQGCGIPSDQMSHIFEPYWQASRERRQGLGLGLAIAKGIVEAHGTRIWAESEPGAGSQFCFSLPRAPEP